MLAYGAWAVVPSEPEKGSPERRCPRRLTVLILGTIRGLESRQNRLPWAFLASEKSAASKLAEGETRNKKSTDQAPRPPGDIPT